MICSSNLFSSQAAAALLHSSLSLPLDSLMLRHPLPLPLQQVIADPPEDRTTHTTQTRHTERTQKHDRERERAKVGEVHDRVLVLMAEASGAAVGSSRESKE